MAECTHLDQINDVDPLTQGCGECLRTVAAGSTFASA